MNVKRAQNALESERDSLLRRLRAQNAQTAELVGELRLPWYRIKNEADTAEDDTAEVLIYEAIGGWFGVPASDFVRELNGISAKNIKVRINSPGGSVFDSIAIYNALVKHSANVTVYVDSLAASGASIIAMAGDEIVMMVGSQMMIHDASGVEMGNAEMMREMATFLDKQSDNIASVYAAKAGGEAKEWRAMMKAETWMMAEEAVDLGLASRVYVAGEDKPKPPSEEDEEEKPESETDKPEEEIEGEEDADDAESEEDDEEGVNGPAEEDDPEDVMHIRHPISAMGFKYAGRQKAPKPVCNSVLSDDELDAFIASFK